MHSVTISTAGVMYSVYHSRECVCMCMNRIQSLCMQGVGGGGGGGGPHNSPLIHPSIEVLLSIYMHIYVRDANT